MALLKVNNLRLGYGGATVAENISFSVNKGDYLCIIGENGSGKTTLMKALLGLISPISGEILRGDSLKAGDIGYLPQQTELQRDFPASVWEVVLSGAVAKNGFFPFYKKELKKKARENLKKLGIADLEKSCYRELSGGQQQRVLLARALTATEKMLLLDEPVSGLDSTATAEMYKIIKELNEGGITVIMISHDDSALSFASHILKIGQEVAFGSAEDYKKGEN